MKIDVHTLSPHSAQTLLPQIAPSGDTINLQIEAGDNGPAFAVIVSVAVRTLTESIVERNSKPKPKPDDSQRNPLRPSLRKLRSAGGGGKPGGGSGSQGAGDEGGPGGGGQPANGGSGRKSGPVDVESADKPFDYVNMPLDYYCALGLS